MIFDVDVDVDVESPIGLVSCSSSRRVDHCDHNNQLFQYWNDYPGWGLATLAPGHSEGCHDVAGMHADRSATDQEYIKYIDVLFILFRTKTWICCTMRTFCQHDVQEDK